VETTRAKNYDPRLPGSAHSHRAYVDARKECGKERWEGMMRLASHDAKHDGLLAVRKMFEERKEEAKGEGEEM
jgi:hypothetical protein